MMTILQSAIDAKSVAPPSVQSSISAGTQQQQINNIQMDPVQAKILKLLQKINQTMNNNYNTLVRNTIVDFIGYEPLIITTTTIKIATIAKPQTTQCITGIQQTNIAGHMGGAATLLLPARQKHKDIKMMLLLKIAWEVPMHTALHALPDWLSELQIV